MNVLEKKIIEIISSILSLGKNEVTLNDNIISDLKADELDMIEIIMDCEKVFNISIDDEKVEVGVKTVSDLVRLIESINNGVNYTEIISPRNSKNETQHMKVDENNSTEKHNKSNGFQTQQSLPKHDCEILIQAATPNIYRINAFRISGLNVNATTREIGNQIQKNQMIEKYGGKLDNNKSPFPIVPAPDNDKLRQALHRLRDPEMRIIDEFFWFWPHGLDSVNKDHALEALLKNDIKTAESLWINYEATLTESNVSRHNLAVLSHLQVLDIELNGQSLTDEEISKRDKYWKDTFKRWKLLLEHEGFWSRLTARVRQMGDPRLTTGFVKRLRESLPFAVLQINAVLALKAAEAGNKSEAQRQLAIMNDSGFEPVVVSSVLKKIANPLRSRIRIMCKTYSDETYPEKEKELIACEKLLEQAMPILNILHTLFPKDNLIKEGAYDDVTLTVASLAIEYSNATNDSENVLPIFEQLRKIVIGESATNRVEKNYEIFKSNIEYDRVYKYCFFCKQNKSDESAMIEKPMHGEVKKDHYNNRITWKHLTVKVPRCNQCKKEHNKQDNIITWGIIGSIIVGIATAAYFDNVGFFYELGIILGVCGIIMSIIIGIGSRKTKARGSFDQFPQIKELSSKGWNYGAEPNTE